MLILFTKHQHAKFAHVFWWHISILCHVRAVGHDDETSRNFCMKLNIVYSNFSQSYSHNTRGDNLNYDLPVCARKL